MEENILRQAEFEDVVFYTENQYSRTDRMKYLETFKLMVADGHLSGQFNDEKWIGFSGIKRFAIDFSLDKGVYQLHIGKEFGISYSTMQDMLRCFALYIMGGYIFPTINQKIAWVKQYLETWGDKALKLPSEAIETIGTFLLYIGTPDSVVADMKQRIHIKQAPKSQQRELSHLINYLAIANEINDLYHTDMPEDEFKKWFPIFFWANVTFVIPLRATEMLVTPINCIKRDENGRISITLRRTLTSLMEEVSLIRCVRLSTYISKSSFPSHTPILASIFLRSFSSNSFMIRANKANIYNQGIREDGFLLYNPQYFP